MGSAVTVVAEERNSLSHIARTTIAALASPLIAQSLHMPEPYLCGPKEFPLRLWLNGPAT